jgi:hypothetical protein
LIRTSAVFERSVRDNRYGVLEERALKFFPLGIASRNRFRPGFLPGIVAYQPAQGRDFLSNRATRSYPI